MTELLPSSSLISQLQPSELGRLKFETALSSLRARRITQGAGTLLVLLGLTVMTGWLLHLPSLIQLLPGQVGMVFSTAICFALAGVALLIPGRWPTLRRRGQTALGGLMVLAAGAMLV